MWRFEIPVICFTFGGKFVRTAKSRQHGVLLERTKRSSSFNDFPQFSWSDLTDKEEIGRWSFGCVFTVQNSNSDPLKNEQYHMSWDKKKLSGSCISKQETIIIIHVKLRWKSQSFFKGSQVSSSRKLRLRKLRPRKLRPLDKTIDILKRSFEWTFIYDNDRDSPQVSNHATIPRPVKGFVYFYSKQERKRQDRIR